MLSNNQEALKVRTCEIIFKLLVNSDLDIKFFPRLRNCFEFLELKWNGSIVVEKMQVVNLN